MEEDTVRLQNRVRVLLKEEERVEKRIAETGKRITLAENARRQNEAKKTDKALRQATEQQQLSIRRLFRAIDLPVKSPFSERNAQLRREGKKLRDERIAQLKAEKTALAKEGKEEKQLHKSLVDEDLVSEKKRAQEKNAEVKQLETEIKRKLTIHQTTKANKVTQENVFLRFVCVLCYREF